MVNILEVLVLLPRIYAGDAMLFNNPASPAEQENVLLIYVLTIFQGKSTLTSPEEPRTTTSSVFKKFMGRTNSYKLFRCWPHNSGFLGS